MPNSTSDNMNFIDDFSIKDESDLATTVYRLLKKKEREPLSQYEKALIELHEAAMKGSKGIIDLTGKGLNRLPREIAVFRNLIELRLSGNNLTSIPDSIGKLRKLKRLHLQNNYLSYLPPEIVSLNALEAIFLQDNELKELPSQIGNLTHLQELNVSNNSLYTLPSSAAKLSSLREIRLQGNQIPIPPEIAARSSLDIIAFVLQVTAEGARSISEAKVLFVGEGGVGKTSLVKRMIEDGFDEYEPKTEGILIKNWHVNVYRRWIRMNVWDFGGQEIMHATHQFFLTERSLYILVWDARQEDDYCQLEYWLNIVQSFSNDAPVIIVLNKTDIGLTEIDRRWLKRKFPSIKAFVNSSCKNGTGIAELKDHISWQVHQLSHTTTIWPSKWFLVKNQLELTNKDYISLAEYDDLCSHVNIESEDDRRNLLQFLHDLGIVLSFHKDARLCDTNVLNPEWATGGVYKILNDEKLFGKGILDIDDLARILNSVRYPRAKHGFVINIMQKFELCYQIDDKDKTRFLIPDLLTKQQPFFKWDFKYSLAFQYHYNFLPGSVISRFIVRMHSFIDKGLAWRNGTILRDGKNRALIISDMTAKKIFIYVDGLQTTRRDLLAKIRINFEHIHRTISKIEAAAKVPLPENHNIVVDYQHLINLESLGEEEFIPEGLRRKVKVWGLLFGVDKSEMRGKFHQEAKEPDEEATKMGISIINTFTGIERQSMSIDRSHKIKAGRDISISQSQVMLDEIKGHVSNNIEQISNDNTEIKRSLQELKQLIEEDPVLSDNEKAMALKKTGLLAQLASKAIEATEDLIEDTIRGIKGTIVDGSTHLFESGKELLHQINQFLLKLL